MIVYRLSCDQDHRFEGWFQSSEDFERQHEVGAVLCPMCDSAFVSRLPSAPHVRSGRETGSSDGDHAASIGLRKLVRLLKSITDDVGEAFPDEARKIHYREAPPRNIRGYATQAAVQDLEDEGIEVLPLPDLPKLH